MNKVAYSLLEVKSFDDGQRVIRGIATSPTPDRVGDIIDPFGVVVAADIPLFLYHDSEKTVGRAVFGKPTAKGIPFEAQLPLVAEAGALKDRVDEAWAMVRHGLIKAVSVGFRLLDDAYEALKGGGIKYLKTEVLELSLVPVPAQPDAVITSFKAMADGQSSPEAIRTLKSLDTQSRAASGARVARLTPPGVSGKANPETPKGISMKTIQEQIADFTAKRKAAEDTIATVMTKSGEQLTTLDEHDSEAFDNAQADIASIDQHIARLKAAEAIMVAKATPITTAAGASQAAASDARGGVISIKSNLPPGIEFARYAMCLATARGNTSQALEIAKNRYPDEARIHTVLKAAVAAGTTTDATWAAPLADYQRFSGDFIEYLRPKTILGRFGTNGIPDLVHVPFMIKVGGQTSGGAGYWVGQGAPKPLTKFDFADVTLAFTKVANIAVITEELARFSSPSAEARVRDALSAALIERMDIDFIDPAKAAVAGVSPASITNGLTGITTAGNEVADIATDVRKVFTEFLNANISPTNGVWIMSGLNALALSQMVNTLGNPAFPGLTLNGGTFQGLPVIVSQYVPISSGASPVILVDASEVYLADDGQVVIDASREASLQMLDNPTNNSATGTATTMVSMFQTNSIAIRAERFVNWQKRRAAAVAYVAAAKWGQPEA